MNINPEALRILCFGDSNTRGYIPGSMGKKRYPSNVRWTGVLQSELGNKYEVIEEGLDARTTAYNDPRPEYPLRNGRQLLQISLDIHKPFEWVVIMLGTTDTKEMLGLTPQEIARGMEENIKLIKSYDYGDKVKVPEILMVTPPVVKEEAEFASQFFEGATEKGKQLVSLYKNLAKKYSCNYLDSSNIAEPDGIEGVHLTKESHKNLGEAIFKIIKK